jgi:D-arabinose 1-dehydrogenase-like Zn-dependent alcohol dehydrogenase
MIGAKPGDRVIVFGANLPEMAADLALATGLNGRLVVRDGDPSAQARTEAAAARAGALVEFDAAVEAVEGEWDAAVVARSMGSMSADERTTHVGEAMRILRDGGRVIVIDGTRAGRWPTSIFARREPQLAPADVLATLDGTGARASRLLADVGGVRFYEARKAIDPAASRT